MRDIKSIDVQKDLRRIDYFHVRKYANASHFCEKTKRGRIRARHVALLDRSINRLPRSNGNRTSVPSMRHSFQPQHQRTSRNQTILPCRPLHEDLIVLFLAISSRPRTIRNPMMRQNSTCVPSAAIAFDRINSNRSLAARYNFARRASRHTSSRVSVTARRKSNVRPAPSLSIPRRYCTVKNYR